MLAPHAIIWMPALRSSSSRSGVTRNELAAGMKTFFSQWDADRNGTLDQKEIADGLQKLVPAPKGFGPPPKGP